MSDPLMHLIRNAIDHGVEPPEERTARGKGPCGSIRLDAYPKGNRVVITVEDDGAGMDPERIRLRAIEKGLVSRDVALTRRETLDLVFLPGFSTKEQVSEVSGRGVGLDVVKKNVARLSGTVDIETEIVTLPITLAIIKALIVDVSTETFAIPLTAVSETLAVDAAKVDTIERREVITLRGETLPLVRLGRLLSLPEHDAPAELYVVVVGTAERRLGFVVDRLAGQQEVVIKGVGEKLSGVRGIAGACELGDNLVVLVLDVESLTDEATLKR
jgi:two-component system, chemotaxis family, sensor kinase CheA